MALTEKNYVGLLAARTGLAAFIQRSEREARAAGATHTQHHVLLALRGHDDTTAAAPTLRVKGVAAALGIASPSAVELITRMVTAGLLRRQDDPRDARRTRVTLTALGERLLRALSELHLPLFRELHRANIEHLTD